MFEVTCVFAVALSNMRKKITVFFKNIKSVLAVVFHARVAQRSK
jgi:hypothetical protein